MKINWLVGEKRAFCIGTTLVCLVCIYGERIYFFFSITPPSLIDREHQH